MSTARSIDELAGTLRDIYSRNPGQAEQAFEKFLNDELGGLDPEERDRILEKLEEVFPAPSADTAGQSAESLISLLLGRKVTGLDVCSQETLERLGESLNVIFSTLNELVHVINSSLGGSPAGDETIRYIIGSTLEGEDRVKSIEEYLGQIKRAFLIAQQSSREAARTVAGSILEELDPKALEESVKGLRIGPLKKAEAYENFEQRYRRVMKWFDSDRFQTDFLRHFEKNCRKSFS